MKLTLITFIALGLVMSADLVIQYDCEGQEMFPTFYGSPFVFKKKSLASSMEYYYSISGIVLNVFVWSCVLFFIDRALQKLFQKIANKKLITVSYKVAIGFIIAFAALNIAVESTIMLGRGFDGHRNYWYWDMDAEAKAWGMTCRGKWTVF